MRPIIAIVAAALLALVFASAEASARQGVGGFRGGGFHGGGFRAGAFHGGGFRGAAFHGGGVRAFHGGFHGGFRGHGFRHFRSRFAFGGPFVYGAYAAWPYDYGYGDDCLAPRRVWTPYGWRIRWVNVCYY